jgi:hypothetical protein
MDREVVLLSEDTVDLEQVNEPLFTVLKLETELFLQLFGNLLDLVLDLD